MRESRSRQYWIINATHSAFFIPWKEFREYKDLFWGLVRRELLSSYQQTLLGPLWLLLSPLLSVAVYVVVFSRIIGLETEGVPAFFYYLTGIALWGLFSDVLTGTATVISSNTQVFGKVYFPRLIVPLALMITHLLRFSVVLVFLILLLVVTTPDGVCYIDLSRLIFFFPAVLLSVSIALGGGLMVSVITTRYRDLIGVFNLGVRLFMFVCPIFYSVKGVEGEYAWLVKWNPLTPLFELFRYGVIGKGTVELNGLLYSAGFALVVLMTGIGVFNRKVDDLTEIA